MTTPTTKRPSVRAQAAERELEALKALASCGWLTTKQIALWVWINSSEHVAVNKAQLVLKRLKEKREVMARETEAGVTAWILTKGGAERVNVELEAAGYKGWAHHGLDLGMFEYGRTMTLNDFLAKKRREENVVAVVGKAGLRAGVIKGLEEADGAYAKRNSDGGYTVVGVLAVTNAREALQAKYKALLRLNYQIDLAGDARLIATLRQRCAV